MMYTKEQREEQIKKMEAVSSAFYTGAVHTHVHAFVEFCGFMNKFISVCQQTSNADRDFNEANTHTGNELVVHDHDIIYLAEKFDCIFGPILADPVKRRLFFRQMGWLGDSPCIMDEKGKPCGEPVLGTLLVCYDHAVMGPDGQPANPRFGRIRDCQACSIEAEIGNEENPHPVPERFHTCAPVKASAA